MRPIITDRQNVDTAMLSLLNNGINPETNNPLTLNVCVYIATCKMFIFQLFIKCSTFIGGI